MLSLAITYGVAVQSKCFDSISLIRDPYIVAMIPVGFKSEVI